MNKRIVHVADFIVSASPAETLITYALGSCLGISIYDPLTQIGGLAHCQLPAAPRSNRPADFNPAQFVDTGVAALLEACFALGARKSRLVVAVAGGADVMHDLQNFKIAHRNHAVLRKILWKNELLIAAEAVGGQRPRTMSLALDSGEVVLQSDGERQALVPAREARRTVALAD